MSLTKIQYVILFVGSLVVLARPSFAYIDPGTGSYFAQMVIATVTSFMLFFVKPIVNDIKQLFKKNKKLEDNATKESADDTKC